MQNRPISVSPVVIEDTGARAVELDTKPGKEDQTRMEIISRKAGLNQTQPQIRMETQPSDLSEDESCVLEVNLECNGEYEQVVTPRESEPLPQVRGRLKRHISFWEKIEAPEFIKNTIREGYRIPIKLEPPYVCKSNNMSARMHDQFVSDAIRELLEGDRITEVKSREELHIVNPLSVSVQPSGKKRLILDLRILNACLHKRKIKFEDHRKVLEYFSHGGFMIKFDLKSGYHHLDIFPQHRKYLGFCWQFLDGSKKYFMFNVLPFGLSTAPYIFTKLLRPLVKLWRCRGLHMVVYLDDGFGLEQCFDLAANASHHVQGDLFAAGFIVAEEKSVWPPTQNLEWLGIDWDARDGTISISAKRIEKAQNLIKDVYEHPKKSARELAVVVGSIISMSAVIGPLSRIMTRHCQISIAAANDWDSVHDLDNYCISEIQFWHENLKKVNKKDCFIQVANNKMIYSDASSYACGALVKGESHLVCHKMFSPDEIKYSSTRRELITILFSLQAFGKNLYNSRIKWFTDNQATAKIIEVGSMRFELQLLAVKIFSRCLSHNIDLYINWIPRSKNTDADLISKIRDCDDWQITTELFQYLDSLWGPYTIDCFASFYNTKLQRFFSRFWNPGCIGVDAFFQPWANENCWIVPPVNIVTHVLNYMSTQKATGTLIVPAWPSAVFWPILWQRFGAHIIEYKYFRGKECCLHGRNTKSLIGSHGWQGYIIALRLSFL